MSCTPQEIEKKRRIALAKLQAKKFRHSAPDTTTNTNAESNQTNQQIQPQQTMGIKNHFNQENKFSPKARSSVGNISYNTKPYAKQEIKIEQFFGQKVITGVCSLISDTRFEIVVAYHVKVLEIFKTIPSAIYNPSNKMWNFKIEHYDLLINKLTVLQPDVVFEQIPNYVINLCKTQTPDSSNVDLTRVEPELLNILMPFQKEGVCFGINHNGRCLIADEMGLGKTLQALAIASYYKKDWPLLIITTSSMRNTWEQAIYTHLPSVPLACVRYMTTGKDYINDAHVLIVSYDMMSRCTDKLVERRFGCVIADESHTIKNFKAKCTKSAIALSKVAKRIILLSGTPALSRPSELYSQLSLIDDRFFGNFFDYSKRYCNGQTTKFGWDASGSSNLTELEIVLLKRFMIRRTKAEVLTGLPSKSREVIKLDVCLNRLSEKERLCLNALVNNYIGKKAHDKHVALLSLFGESAKIKIPSVCLYIEQTIKTNQKFLVFAHHQVMLDAICEVLVKNKKKYIRIDGSTTSEQRKYFIDKFQFDESVIAAVLSITAANAGITLTAAQLVLFAELHWNPSILSQAESRAHRIGQAGNVIVRYLLGTGTVDDHIWPLLQSKQDVLNGVGLSKDSFKDTAVSDQVVMSSSQSGMTAAGTKSITEYFNKSQTNETDMDQTLQEFLADDDDDLFINAQVDY